MVPLAKSGLSSSPTCLWMMDDALFIVETAFSLILHFENFEVVAESGAVSVLGSVEWRDKGLLLAKRLATLVDLIVALNSPPLRVTPAGSVTLVAREAEGAWRMSWNKQKAINSIAQCIDLNLSVSRECHFIRCMHAAFFCLTFNACAMSCSRRTNNFIFI